MQTNKNTNTILLVVIAILVLGGITYAVINKDPVTPVVVTPTPSTPNTATPPPTVTPGPPKVTTDSTIAPWSSTAVVTGTVNPNGAITTYWFEYGLQPNSTSRTTAQTLGSGYMTFSTPGYITGLSSNTKYYFRLVADNGLGKVMGQQYAFQTTLATPPQGTAPTTQSLAASVSTRTTVNVNGRINPNGVPTTFWFEYGQSSSLGSVTVFQPIGNAIVNQDVSVSLTGLQPQTKYYFRLNAQNQLGTTNGTILTFTTQGPAVATAPTIDTKAASSIASTTATLNGSVIPNGSDATYWFEYSTNALTSSLLGTATSEHDAGAGYILVATNQAITGLSPNTKYYYRIGARNSLGTTRGDSVTFTTKK
jgi:phosphodiesterase/alkaline phosphatase D-like protein